MSDPYHQKNNEFSIHKFRHFYKNKYLVSPFSKKRYYLSYNYQFKCLWFRTYKVASRTINQHFLDNTPKNKYIYADSTGYCPADFKDYVKFAFVRNPEERFISCWKDKVLNRDFYQFGAELHEEMKVLTNFISWVEKQDITHSADAHLRTQHSLIDIENLDFLGRFENFNSDFKQLADRIGMPIKEVHAKNRTQSRPIEVLAADHQRIQSLYIDDYHAFYPNLLP